MAIAVREGQLGSDTRDHQPGLGRLRLARSLTVQMGCVACYAVAPMTAEQVRRTAVPNTLSLALRLGGAVQQCPRPRPTTRWRPILDTCPGRVLFSVESQGDLRTAHHRRIRPGDADHRSGLDSASLALSMVIEFQNENLIAKRNGEIVCTGAGPHLRRGLTDVGCSRVGRPSVMRYGAAS